MRARQDRLAESLARIYAALGPGPADGPGVQVLRAGLLRDRRAGLGDRSAALPRARPNVRWSCSTPGTTPRAPTSSSSWRSCCVPGASAPSTSTRRFYADDDLMVGAADPFQLFRIMNEIVAGDALRARTPGSSFMLDQCHNIEEKIPGQIRSVMNVQEATAKALLVDREALARRAAGRATCSARNARAHGRLQHRRRGRCSPICAGGAGPAARTRWPPTRRRGTRSGSPPSASGGAQAGWGA